MNAQGLGLRRLLPFHSGNAIVNVRSIAIVLWHFLMTFLLSITSGGFDMDVTCSRIISFLIE